MNIFFMSTNWTEGQIPKNFKPKMIHLLVIFVVKYKKNNCSIIQFSLNVSKEIKRDIKKTYFFLQ